MQQKEFFFDDLTARDVAERLRLLNEIQTYLNAVMLTVGRLNGAGPHDRVQLNRGGTGVVVIAPSSPPDGGELGVEPNIAGQSKASAGKK